MSDEGEDPSPRPKRKIKKVMVLSSASSSDSDDSSPATSTRKKRLRVLSEHGSDSSSGSWAMGAIRRRRALPGLRDSEGDSDSSGWATDHSDDPQTSAALAPSSTASKSPASKAKAVSGFSSDSSEGNSEKCSICLMKFLNQEVGIPQNCEHIFCLDCITEWSKNMNTCPVDRITFDSIVVRACAGGRVLRTEQVEVAERRPSLEMMIIEDPTVCEICHNADREESMLLCDGCDLGFHMQCLTPPLARIPEDQWLCPNCNGVWRSSPIFFPMQSHSHSASERTERAARATRDDEPSTSSGRRRGPAPRAARPAARGARARAGASAPARRTSAPRTRKRKYKRRRTRTVIVEYEVEGEGKFPITMTKRVKTRIKRRKMKRRQPRTAARRTHVLASVRAKLASVRAEGAGSGAGDTQLRAQRAGAGIPQLSLFGSAHQLDYFDEDDDHGSEGATTAVAARPTSSVLSAYRQARRKMVAIPSPPHASAAPDLLSDILERQTLLHSKHSVVSVSVDGNVNIKLESHGRSRKEPKPKKNDKPLGEKKEIDLTKGGEGTRQAPSYPGQGRGWGGGYRYPRDQNNHQQNHNQGNQGYGRGGYDNGYGAAARGGGPFERRSDDSSQFNDYANRRSHHFPGESWHDRNRRHPDHNNRGPNNQRNDERRSSGGPVWRPNRPEGPPHRQSFGGFENPLDMRMGHESPGFVRANSVPEAARPDKPQPYQPLPQPPTFQFEPALAADKSEDERSDEGLIIDTEKYDPTEPTHDDDSGEEPEPAAGPALAPAPAGPEPERTPSPAPSPSAAPSVQTILAGIDTRGIDVPAGVLDSAVRAALQEHRALLAPAVARDGDCPNFSIYSATSVHIASDSSRLVAEQPVQRRNSLEDLVQEDGELTPPPPPEIPPPPPPPCPEEKTLEEYKAKVSKRCPITTNTRNPIKIKLHTPSLIKRQVTLYDDEDVSQDLGDRPEPALESQEPAPKSQEPAVEAPAAADEPKEDDKFPTESELERRKSTDDKREVADALKDPKIVEDGTGTPLLSDEDATPKRTDEAPNEAEEKDIDDDRTDDELEARDKDKSKFDSEDEASTRSGSGRSATSTALAAKMTESISETEDERSYTPCLDENKSKDASLEDKGIEGLDTEMISEEEANDMFSEGSPPTAGAPPPEEGEILDRRPKPDDAKKKKKKEGKKDKEKGKTRKRGDVAFKKVGKGKERNYRERDKEKEKRRSPSSSRERRRRKDKRKDLERYDVRTLVSERRRRTKDAFGRDVSPSRSPSPAPAPPRCASSSPAARRARPSPSPPPRRARFSPSPPRRRASPSPRRPRLSPSPRRARISPSPRRKASPSPPRRSRASTPRRPVSAASVRRSPSPKRRRKRSGSRGKVTRRRRSTSRVRKRRRSAEPAASPKPTKAKKKKRARSPRAASKQRSPRRRSPRRKRARRRSDSPAEVAAAVAAVAAVAWSPAHAPSPRTPPPAEPVPLEERRRRREVDRAHRRLREAAGPSKEVFTSGDNILVSVSFKEQERVAGLGRASRRAERRRRKRAAAPEAAAAKPVAIIDLERSPFRELTPSPKNVIVLSDDEAERAPAAAPAAPPEAAPPQGPKTPPDPAGAAPPPIDSPPKPPPEASSPRGPLTPPEPPDSPDAYDPYEPTRSASASPAPPAAPAAPPPADDAAPPSMTLEAAQKTNLSADEVLDRRPLSPIEKVMALLQSTRDVSPEEPRPRSANVSPGTEAGAGGGAAAGAGGAAAAPPAPRVLLPDAPRPPPKLFLAKPSPIKSDPIKPMPQATKISRLPLPAVVAGVRRVSGSPGASPYSPGSSDFGDLFEPPAPLAPARAKRNKRNKKNKTTVDVKLDDDSLKVLDELPSSAVEMQVKSKVSDFLKKLNRQERVVEEVKLVLKPHYNKKHVSKDQYKHILRRAVPKICHNKTGEINPMKIQALVEAYVKKFRKKRKLGQ